MGEHRDRRLPIPATAPPKMTVSVPVVAPQATPGYSQLLESRVELHVHSVESVQASPVLYVSAGREERSGHCGQGQDANFRVRSELEAWSVSHDF